LNGPLYGCSRAPKMLPPAEEERRVDCRGSRGVPQRLVLFLLLLFPSCGGTSLPPAPSQVTSGLTVYEHANYLGSTALVTSSISNLDDFKGPCEHDEGGDEVDARLPSSARSKS
jgi:hypothetical protein